MFSLFSPIFREERIVHVNVGWVQLTGYSAVDCEGQSLSSLFNMRKDIYSQAGFKQFRRLINILQSNDNPLQPPSDCPGSPPFIRPPKRDCHAPQSYEVANVRINKKLLFPLPLAPLSDPNMVAMSDIKLASSPSGVMSFPAR
jgi:hypothetical protein